MSEQEKPRSAFIPPEPADTEPLIPLEDDDAPPPDTGNVGHRRDRIVILGQPQAGKTIYLARLYDRYFHAEPDAALTMRTLNGQVHLKLMEVMDLLEQGVWPAATGGMTYVDLEINFRRERFELVSLDYPGEVFSKTFLLGRRDPDCLELIEHLDRAAGIILMVEPSVVASRSRVKAAETEFGMTAAIRYVKARRDGLGVPVALLFTKLDRNHVILREAGGLRAFAQAHCGHILAEIPGLKLFAVAAVRGAPGPDGRWAPCLRKAPIGLEGAFLYCLEVLVRTRWRDRERSRTEGVASPVPEPEPDRPVVPVAVSPPPAGPVEFGPRFWIVFTLMVIVLLAGAILFALSIVTPPPGSTSGIGSGTVNP